MKSARRTLMTLMGAAAIATTAMGAFAQDVTLRMHQFLPDQANVPKHILAKWAADVEAASDGRIKIQSYPAMSLGGAPPELYDQAVDGVADIIWTVAGYTPGRFPEAEVFELPFTMTNADAASRAFWQLAQDTLINDEMSDTHVLGLWVHGPGIIHSKNPIQSVEDLKGVKLRAPTRVTNMLLSNLGSESIGMPVPAIPENLSKGVIDAAIIPWEVVPALKVQELVKNHTTFPGEALYTTTFIFTMNKDKYESLPDDLKAAIDSVSGLEFSAFAGRKMQELDGPSRQMAKDAGNNIIELSADEIQSWKDAAASTKEQWIAEMNEKGMDGQALADRAVQLIAENTK